MLFLTNRGGALSHDALAQRLARYVARCPRLAGRTVTPHVLRYTPSMPTPATSSLAATTATSDALHRTESAVRSAARLRYTAHNTSTQRTSGSGHQLGLSCSPFVRRSGCGDCLQGRLVHACGEPVVQVDQLRDSAPEEAQTIACDPHRRVAAVLVPKREATRGRDSPGTRGRR
jgi:hypothetical protein